METKEMSAALTAASKMPSAEKIELVQRILDVYVPFADAKAFVAKWCADSEITPDDIFPSDGGTF